MKLKHFLAIIVAQVALTIAGSYFGMDAIQQLIQLLFFSF